MDWTRSRPNVPASRRIATQHFALYGADDIEGSTIDRWADGSPISRKARRVLFARLGRV